MEEEAWPSEWLRGVLGPAILSILSEGEAYGYLIAQRLEQGGLGRAKGGTLYPLLSRYESAGLLASSWREGEGGPGRKFFTITGEGPRNSKDCVKGGQNFPFAPGHSSTHRKERNDWHQGRRISRRAPSCTGSARYKR
ncbi:PadR family transcriptional regulator [Leucobacter insecticola]|uniref:PadR family transcriptional regulator n=1 Tax=Leucobacter insecticola TaxID=2714934 RepID=UPI001FCB6418|nr:PadR family transcriptional regulator [Leucobacter insecticola]